MQFELEAGSERMYSISSKWTMLKVFKLIHEYRRAVARGDFQAWLPFKLQLGLDLTADAIQYNLVIWAG